MADTDDAEWVVRVLVAAANDELPLDTMTEKQLFEMIAAHRQGREALRLAVLALNDRGVTYSEIARHFGVHESTAYRWARPDKRKEAP